MNLFTNLPPENASDAVKAAHIAKYRAFKQSKTKPADTKSTLERSREILASAQKTAENVTPWRRYRSLQQTDPRAAGIYWRANKQAIVDCIE